MTDQEQKSFALPILDVEAVVKTTFAAAQNAVPIIRRISIRNESEQTYSNVRLVMKPQPAFCRTKEWAIDRLPQGGVTEIGDRRLTLDFSVLDRLNEAEHGQLVFSLLDGDELLNEQVVPIELLARDEWGGSDEMSQILAAFVSPNHPAIAAILKEASRQLERGGHSGALDGYQSRDPRRAYMIAAAIWSAISGMGLSYAQPPRSFEQQGQKVRDPGCIAKTGLATCLDTALLLAAAFEAVKLNPIVVFTNGHAFVCVWLVDKTFPMTVEHDVTEVRKAVNSRELVALESTLLTHRPPVDFEQAKANGKSQLADDSERPFHMAVDITRARAAGIRPISSLKSDAAVAVQADDSVAPALLPKLPDLDQMPFEYAEELAATPGDRLDRWQKKLLDLSLRNRLLNFASTKQTLGLVCADVPALEDALAGGSKFRVISIKDENPIGNRDPKLYQQQTGRDIQHDFAATAFDKGQLCAVETGKEMKARLTALYRKAKSDLAEGGANTLFLAVGFLRWKKDDKDDRVYRAPLLLLPIKLSRKSAKSAYVLSHHEDDVVFNQTLLEFLERDFGLTIPALRGALPEDHSGIDIQQIFETMIQAVREVPGFEVVDDIAVSTFSFAKYLMWKDLVDRTDSLKNNRLVRHLLENPTKRFQDGAGDFPTAETIDERIDPVEVFTPLPADSSQLAAVVAAQSGKDFVIIGPPGTGKSQTIANMIAHCLAHGKTVLFVAEKSAALDVVYRRLKAYGLADACLELHSNKTDRKSVIAQLGTAWDRSSRDADDEWVRLTENLQIQRNDLNLYVSELHEPGSHGYSVYDGIGFLIGNEPKFDLSFAGLRAHDERSFESLVDVAERLALAHAAVVDCHSLSGISKTEWSFAWEKKLLDTAERFRDETVALKASCNQFESLLGITIDPEMTNVRLKALIRLAKSIGKVSNADYRFASGEDLGAVKSSIGDLERAITTYRTQRESMAGVFEDDEILRIPLDQIDQDWRRESSRMWPFSLLGKRRIQRLLQSYTAQGQTEPDGDIQLLISIKSALESIDSSPASCLPVFDGVATDMASLRESLQIGLDLRTAVNEVTRTDPGVSDLFAALHEVLRENGEQSPIAKAAASVGDARASFDQTGKSYMASAGGMPAVSSLQGLIDQLAGVKQQAKKLNDWAKWSKVKQEAEGRGLTPMTEALLAGLIKDPKPDFFVAYFGWWLPLSIDLKPKLRSFVHWEQESQIEKFKELIEAVQQLSASEIRRAVSHGLPARDGVPRKSELGMLRHQLGLQRPSESIRGLIESMPETFTKLTPCVLMSPLSVAQYLPADHASFDMVIFDEASQITTWDAVGAIARGSQSIIVGDPKQLPPTNFFGRTNDEEEEGLAAHERDLSSILDEASAAGLPLHQLNWHYRSRDEGLIAFSNYHYYGQRLVTFPSPTTASDAVQFHKVAGVYARGSGRTNEIEAKEVVRYVFNRLEEWIKLDDGDRLSIGVITFNAPQQELILDLLDAERATRPHLEWFFSDEREEPVIVKNLENVQGDERDVMLFSITFGRDEAGKLPMDFGAVNREGGEKRLNVAVTRAKSEFHIFSSISSEDIDAKRAKGLGVSHLKNYLDYAERGAVALPAMDEGSLGPAESPFEESVADALRGCGWEVRTQIGVSGYRIDLGIVHPDLAGAYLAGIECDGATYHSSATARDRDQIREGVLRHLGWEILRVWSTDWFMRPEDALARMDEALKELLEGSRITMREAEEAQQDAVLPEDEHVPESDDADIEFEDETLQGERVGYGSATSLLQEESTTTPLADDRDLAHGLDAEQFFEQAYTPTLMKLIDQIVEQQGPISGTSLYRMVTRLHGWQRAGRRIQERVLACLGANDCRIENGNMFVWPPDSFATQMPFRAALDRSPRDVPQAEILGLLKEQPHTLIADDPAKEIANLMGLGRLSLDTRAYLEACITRYRDLSRSD
ncbi:MAG: DUF3320 domain-containing protein [Phycisphaerales bacterium]